MATSKAGLMGNIVFIKSRHPTVWTCPFFEQWVVRIPCAFINIVDPIIRAVIIFSY
jgi:hypothetical protein